MNNPSDFNKTFCMIALLLSDAKSNSKQEFLMEVLVAF